MSLCPRPETEASACSLHFLSHNPKFQVVFCRSTLFEITLRLHVPFFQFPPAPTPTQQSFLHSINAASKSSNCANANASTHNVSSRAFKRNTESYINIAIFYSAR